MVQADNSSALLQLMILCSVWGGFIYFYDKFQFFY